MKINSFFRFKIAICVTAVACGVAMTTPSTQAMFTNHFDPLLAELQLRTVQLTNILATNRTDKVARTQKGAIESAVRTLNRSTKSVATDITAAAAASKVLQRAFASEFSVMTISQPSSAAPLNLNSLLRLGFIGLQTDVQSEIDSLRLLVDGLSAGKARTSALGQLTAATNSLATISNGTSFANWAKSLSTALTKAAAGKKTALKASGSTGGPTGGNTMSATIVVNGGAAQHWTAKTNWAEWVQSAGTPPGLLTVEGDAMNLSPGYYFTVPIMSGFTGMTGTYTMTAGAGGTSIGLSFQAVTSGTITITSFNAATHTCSGTFSFVASDGSTTITVNNGMFNVKNLLVTP